MNILSPDTAFLLMLALPFAASPVVYLVGRISARMAGGAGPARWLAILAMLALWVPLAICGQFVAGGNLLELSVGGAALRMDGISLVLAGAAAGLGALVLFFSVPYMAREDNEEKFYALMLVIVGAMIGLGCANDLFNLWVWFETMTISSYLLVAFYHNQRGSLEAGFKYLVQSAVGSVLVMIGVAIVFATTSTLRLTEIAAAYGAESGAPSLAILAAGGLFIIGFGVKSALVPMHTWLPDAHSKAPSGISAMLSGIVIEAGLVAMLRSAGSLPVLPGGEQISWGALLLGFAALNILAGNLMALRQKEVKRLLAYSSLSHMGYMLLGFGVAAAFHLPDAAAGGFFHLINHALMKGLAFLAAGVLLYALHIARGDHSPLMVDDLNGASRRYPLAAFAFSVAVLALGGLPPLAGFMSKWQIFVAGAETRNLWVILLVVFAALNSVLSLGYYAPLVNRLYRRETSDVVRAGVKVRWIMSAPLVVLVVAVVVLGCMPWLISGITNPAADTLVSMFGGAAMMAGR